MKAKFDINRIVLFAIITCFFFIASVCSGNNNIIQGIIDHYGWDSHTETRYISITNEQGTKKYYFTPETLCLINNTEADIYKDETMFAYSIYSYKHYPRTVKLSSDKKNNIKEIHIRFKVLKGFIRYFKSDKNIISVHKKPPNNRIQPIQEDLDPEIALANMNAWNLFSKNKAEFVISSDAIIRHNYKSVDRNEIKKYMGKEIHIVLSENKLPKVFNIYQFDDKAEFAGSACTGYVLQWEHHFTRLKIWQPDDIFEFDKENYSTQKIKTLIEQDKIKNAFTLKRIYKFSKDTHLYISGQEKKLADRYGTRSYIEVNTCFFYGPTYIHYNNQGEIKDIIVPYEYGE